ncbi:MAG TPA: hypothetical protein VF982_06800 [Anaerolineales bacterium]
MAGKPRKPESTIAVVPANKVSSEDLMVVLGGARCHGKPCYCQRFKIPYHAWRMVTDEQRNACALKLNAAIPKPALPVDLSRTLVLNLSAGARWNRASLTRS